MFTTPLFINFFPHPLPEMDANNIGDLSSFFLFEATGDSESDPGADAGGGSFSSSMAFNDAESCSDDAADCVSVCEIDGGDHRDREDEEDEEEDGYGYEYESKSGVGLDSTKEFEVMNEMEKNRLFWETCLAS